MTQDTSPPLIKLATLLPGALPIEQGQSETWKGNLFNQDGTITPAYIKIVDEKSLATELLCSVIARELNLPITQPYLVRIENRILESISKETFAFALEDAEFPSISSRTRDDDIIKSILVKWPFLYQCAAFDSWIGNNDRLPHNLLFDGFKSFSLIDHGEALDHYLTENSVSNNNLIMLLDKESEFEKFSLTKNLLKEADKFNNIDFKKVRREIISSNGVVRSEIIDSQIALLQKRLVFLPNIIRTQTGIKQQDFLYDSQKIITESNNKES